MKFQKTIAFAAALCVLTANAAVQPFSCGSGMLSVSAADEVQTFGDFTYIEAEDHVEIKKCKTTEETIEVPSEIDGKPVTAIAATAFYNSKLKKVVLPEGITDIGGGAFWHSANLESVNIPSTVTSIQNHAFADCPLLVELEIPESVTYIGALAFDGSGWCEAQKEKNPFVIVNGVVIDASKALDDILAERAAKEAEEQRLMEEENVKFIKINDTKEEVVTKIEFPEGITGIGETVFVDLKRSINVTDIVIPEGVVSIGAEAFSLCHMCKNIELPSTLVEVGDKAFAETLWVQNYPKEDGMLIVNGLLLDGKECVGCVSVPEGVTSICGNAFSSNKELTGVKLPKSLKAIHDSAFKRCYGLESVTFNEGLEEIGTEVFSECPLKSVVIPKSVKKIGYRAFITCASLPFVSLLGDDVTMDAESFGYLNTFTQTGQYMSVYVLSKNEDFYLYGHAGSSAEKYAEANGLKFYTAMCGDVNEDFRVTISDAILASRIAAEDTQLPAISEIGMANADVNGDGSHAADDITGILNIVSHAAEVKPMGAES